MLVVGVRLNLDGSLDATFQLAHELAGPGFAVSSSAVQPDGRILITGTRTAARSPTAVWTSD